MAMYSYPRRVRRFGHRRDRIAAVAPVGMHVEVAADVASRDERGQAAGPRGADLVHALADLGRNHRQAERRVDLLFGGGDRCAASPRSPRGPSVQPRSAATARQAHDVLERSGEIEQRSTRFGWTPDSGRLPGRDRSST